MNKPYELVVLLHPDLEIDVEAPIAKLETIITNAGGSVTRRDNWGKKRLAYRIAKQDFAIYVYFEVILPAESVRGLENTLSITEEVIRHIVVTHDEISPRSPRKPATPEKIERIEAEPVVAAEAA